MEIQTLWFTCSLAPFTERFRNLMYIHTEYNIYCQIILNMETQMLTIQNTQCLNFNRQLQLT